MTDDPAADPVAVWHYAVGPQRLGPVTSAEIRSLATAGTIDSHSLVWREGMPGWLPVSATELGVLAEVVPAPRPYIEGRTNPAARERWLKSGAEADPEAFGRRYGLWLVTYLLGGVVYVVGGISFGLVWLSIGALWGASLSLTDGRTIAIASGCVLVVIAALTCLTLWIRMLLACWRQVDDGSARTTPGLAVGLTCIPLFQAFWCFTSLYGLAVEMHRVMDENGIPGKRPSKAFALTYSIVNACAVVPLIWVLAAVIAALLAPFLYHQLQRGGRDIAAWRLARSSGGGPGDPRGDPRAETVCGTQVTRE